MSRRFAGLTVLAMMCLGCSSNPTGPTEETFIIRGALAAEGETWHSLMLTDYGGVRIELIEVLLETDEGVEAADGLALGFGLGKPEEDECVTTYRTTLSQGGLFSFSLGEGVHCILMFDAGLLAEGENVEYMLQVTP